MSPRPETPGLPDQAPSWGRDPSWGHVPGGGRSTNGYDENVYYRLLNARIIFLGDEVRDENANAISAQLLLLAAEDPDRDIHLYINSPGGSVSAGLAIYDTMQFIKPDIATYAMGMAASMGQFLLNAGTQGKRNALPNARILMHQPAGGLGGSATDVAIRAEEMLFTKRRLNELQAYHSGQSVEAIDRDSDRDRWFTAEQALEYGFVDHVVANAAQVTESGGTA